MGFGNTLTYKQLAENINNLDAVRAVGTACGLNLLLLLVPCHRILSSDGGLGGYVYGLDIKQKLLELEGVIKKPSTLW